MIPKLPYALINTAVDEILARLALLMDETGVDKVFKSAKRGAILIQENVTPSIAQLPALRAWYATTDYQMSASNFVIVGRDGSQGIRKIVDFDVYLYSPDRDSDGNVVDLQADLINIEQAMILWLEDVDGGDASSEFPTVFVHSQGNVKWYFSPGQLIKATQGTVMKRFGGQHILPPGWYTTTLPISIDIYPHAIVGATA